MTKELRPKVACMNDYSLIKINTEEYLKPEDTLVLHDEFKKQYI